VALKVGKYIEENIPELKVVYTRTDDRFIELEERGRIANRHGGDLFVSIHANAFNHRNKARERSVHGAEVYFLGMARSETALEVMKRENSVIELESGETEELTEDDLLIYELMNAGNMSTSQRIAEMIESQFRERAQRKSRGVKQAGFQVLYEASMPGVLIELGFLSNPNEANYLTSEYGQSIVASAIFRSIRDFKLDHDKSFNRETTSR
jgi:N-acetylmuramoyl-L-alanine amidase